MNRLTPILSIDCSGEVCGVSIFFSEGDFAEFNLKIKSVRSEKLFELIDRCIIASDLVISDIKSIAVSAGPGSFTGLRIGMSAAKGLASGLSIPIIPVPTLDSRAYYISKFLPVGQSFILSIKANIEESYFGKFVSKINGVEKAGEIKALKTSEVANLINKDDIAFSNSPLSEFTSEKQLDIRELPAFGAALTGEWAYIFGKDLLTYEYDFLEPTYLKDFIAKVKK